MRNIIENKITCIQKCKTSMFTHSKELYNNIKTPFSCLCQYFRIGIFIAPKKTIFLFLCMSRFENAQVSYILSIATSHFGTKVTVVDFMCYFSIPSPLKQFGRYLSSFMADKCTFHINLPLGFDRMDTHIYLSLKTTNKKKYVILKNCSFQNNAMKETKINCIDITRFPQ